MMFSSVVQLERCDDVTEKLERGRWIAHHRRPVHDDVEMLPNPTLYLTRVTSSLDTREIESQYKYNLSVKKLK